MENNKSNKIIYNSYLLMYKIQTHEAEIELAVYEIERFLISIYKQSKYFKN